MKIEHFPDFDAAAIFHPRLLAPDDDPVVEIGDAAVDDVVAVGDLWGPIQYNNFGLSFG